MKRVDGAQHGLILFRFGFIELGVVPAMRPSLHSKMNFIFFPHSVSPFVPLQKEKLSQLMYTFAEKTFLLKEKS